MFTSTVYDRVLHATSLFLLFCTRSVQDVQESITTVHKSAHSQTFHQYNNAGFAYCSGQTPVHRFKVPNYNCKHLPDQSGVLHTESTVSFLISNPPIQRWKCSAFKSGYLDVFYNFYFTNWQFKVSVPKSTVMQINRCKATEAQRSQWPH